jgi:hypothetical protein
MAGTVQDVRERMEELRFVAEIGMQQQSLLPLRLPR